jgi:hypothetical protein
MPNEISPPTRTHRLSNGAEIEFRLFMRARAGRFEELQKLGYRADAEGSREVGRTASYASLLCVPAQHPQRHGCTWLESSIDGQHAMGRDEDPSTVDV